MEPRSLSATAVTVFESCEARYRAQYIEGGREPGGKAANLGSAVHDELELMVKGGYWDDPGKWEREWDEITAPRYGLTVDEAAEGLEMLRNWFEWVSENPMGEVIAVEVKESFPIKVKMDDGSDFEVPFNYIWDRGDRHEDGTIEVVDYKSFAAPMPADMLKDKIQVRCYGLSAAMKFKDDPPPAIWVTYHLLRYEPISVKFTRNDNLATYSYLKDLLRRILESDGTRETINQECRWCVRKSSCEALTKHVKAGGSLGISDPESAATTYAEANSAISALMDLRQEMSDYLIQWLDQEETTERDFGPVSVRLTTKPRRNIDAARAAKVLGPELMAKFGTLGVTQVDKLIKDGLVDDEQAAELRRLMSTSHTSKLSVTEKSPFDEV